MKNKHLLLIFFCTLVLGLVAKYAPWFKSDVFQTDLVRVDPAELTRISITLPGKSELLLERSDEGWVASQDDFAIRAADSSMAAILAALEEIRSIRIVHTAHRDTLLLLPTQAIHVELSTKNNGKETFEIGTEILENNQPATFIEIDKHDGIYLTDKYLRRVFARNVNDFRSKTVLAFAPLSLHSVRICRPGADTVYFLKSDTSAFWNSSRDEQRLPPEQVQKWVEWLQQLNGLPFASHLDESHAVENLVVSIALEIPESEEPVLLQIFDAGTSAALIQHSGRLQTPRSAPVFLVQSSQNVFNFFALSDTLLLQKICSGPMPLTMPTFPSHK